MAQNVQIRNIQIFTDRIYSVAKSGQILLDKFGLDYFWFKRSRHDEKCATVDCLETVEMSW